MKAQCEEYSGRLLPCPFCGGEAIAMAHTHMLKEYHVFCYHCSASTGTWQETAEEAAAAWNTRAPNNQKGNQMDEHEGCEDAWHEEIRQLREMIVRQQTSLATVQRALCTLLPHEDGNISDLTQLLQTKLPWIK